LERSEHTSQHPDLGLTSWYNVRAGEQHIAARGAWQHTNLPALIWYRSNQISSRSISMARRSILSRARRWFRTAPIAILTLPSWSVSLRLVAGLQGLRAARKDLDLSNQPALSAERCRCMRSRLASSLIRRQAC
jgi:hypothetical protein